MPLASYVDVIVVGGGCAGLWLSHELNARHVSCIVIDEQPFSQYSSTRNQGWLQSGALYAVLGQYDVARDCQRGYDALKEFAPDSLHPPVNSFLLFRTSEEQHDASAACQQLGLPSRTVSVETVSAQESILRGSPLQHALEVTDCPVDTNLLLNKLVAVAGERGVRFQPVPSVHSISIERQSDRWTVRLPDAGMIQAPLLVLACGSYIPRLLQRLKPGREVELKITKISVLVLRGSIATSILVTPLEDHAPNLVPFKRGQETGVTVCLVNGDVEITDPEDFDVPLEDRRKFVENLAFFYPGVGQHLSEQGPLSAHVYACHKLQVKNLGRASSEFRRRTLIDYGDGLISFYPGKFTAAPVGAAECARQLAGMLGAREPEIATQRYYDPSNLSLSLIDGRIKMES